MQKPYLSYLPPIFGNIKEFRAIADVIDSFISIAYADVEDMSAGFFIESATGEWLSRHERCYGIIPRSSESEDERRFRLLTLAAGELPYTLLSLERMLDSLAGKNAYTVSADAESCTLDVTLLIDSESKRELVGDMLRRQAPANLSLTINNA